MTKLRKLTALLLAGALTLLLLTACSGGGGSSGPEAQAEAEVMQAINKGRTAALANDPDMHAYRQRQACQSESGRRAEGRCIGGYQFYNKVDAKWDTTIRTPP